MSKPTYSYDSECERLAEHFLRDQPTAHPMFKCELAQAIQDAVEAFLSIQEDAPPEDDADRLVTVCDNCLQASCWKSIFMCDEARTAGTVDLPVRRLRELAHEHPDYWEPA
jgi:hypothetical protein